MNFDELLAHFKAESKPEDAMVPILEPALLTYAAVWPRVTVRRVGEPTSDTWDALWACVEVDMDSLEMLMDAPPNKAAGTLRRLQALRVIFPDGTVPDMVKKMISKRVMDFVRGGSK